MGGERRTGEKNKAMKKRQKIKEGSNSNVEEK